MLTINNIFIMSKKRHLNLTLTTRHNDFSYIHSLFYKNIDKGIVFIYKYIISFLLAANTDSAIYNTGLSRKRNSIQTYQGQKTMAITFFDNLSFVNFAEILYQKLGIATAIWTKIIENRWYFRKKRLFWHQIHRKRKILLKISIILILQVTLVIYYDRRNLYGKT